MIHTTLKAAVEVRETAYLWTPADAISFIPRLLSEVYGDGRALFTLSTVNDRPAYWIIRGDSMWQTGNDIHAPSDVPDFSDFTDGILTDLESEFGSARCGYSGSSLRWPASERIKWCQCEECSDEENVEIWPSVDGSGGCSWGRMEWPSAFGTIDHPWTWRANLLASDEDLAFSAAHPYVANKWMRRLTP